MNHMKQIDVLANRAFLLIENSKIGVADAIESVVGDEHSSIRNLVMTVVEAKIFNKKRGLENVPNLYYNLIRDTVYGHSQSSERRNV